MSKFFEIVKEDIAAFCKEQGYSFDKLMSSSMGWNDEDEHLSFSYSIPNLEEDKKGLGSKNKPIGLLLVSRAKNGVLLFEQTEYTRNYLTTNHQINN